MIWYYIRYIAVLFLAGAMFGLGTRQLFPDLNTGWVTLIAIALWSIWFYALVSLSKDAIKVSSTGS